MEGQIGISPDVRLLHEPSECAAGSCNEIAAIDLDGRALCLKHFLPGCISELESRSERLRNLPFDAAVTDAFRNFIAACGRQAQKLADDPRFTDRDSKAGLLEFLFRVSQLSQGMRRSRRIDSSIPIWLRREDPYRTWHEETWTVTLSRHGASLLCHRPVEKDGTVILCRKDMGCRAEARVAYWLHDSQGRKQIGVEFFDGGDFWNLDWNPEARTTID
jgi:hypothetical protein